jgi:hypothetical protein
LHKISQQAYISVEKKKQNRAWKERKKERKTEKKEKEDGEHNCRVDPVEIVTCSHRWQWQQWAKNIGHCY